MRRLTFRTIAFVALGGAAVLLALGADSEEAPSLQVQYHQAMLQLAEGEFEWAQETNRKVAGTFGEQHLERLNKDVKLARTLLENAKQNAGQDMTKFHVLHAEELAKIAASDYRAALEVRERSPASVSSYRLEKFRIKAELARLRVEMWKEPKNLSSLVDHMHWEIDRLSRDMLDVQQRLERLE